MAGALVPDKNPEFIIDFYQRRSSFQRVINGHLLGVPDGLNIVNSAAFAGYLDTSGVSYSIPLPDLGNIAIDVPLH